MSMERGVGSMILLAVVFLGGPFTSYSQPLYPFVEGRKCGYISRVGAITVSPQFDVCTYFSENLAGVSINGKSGYVDIKGKTVIPPRFESTFPEPFSEGFAPVRLKTTEGNEKIGYVDRHGKFTEVDGVTEAFAFSEGLARVCKNGKWGYIDTSFKYVIAPRFRFARSFNDGLAFVGMSNDEFYVDKTGRKIIDDYGTNGGDFSEGLAWFRSKYTGYGFMDTDGRVVIEPQFSYPCFFKEKLACAESDGKWGYIDRAGEFVIPPRFDEAEDFTEEGFAVVKLGGKCGLIDRTGRIIITAKYDRLEWLGGLALGAVGNVREYINIEGNTVWTYEMGPQAFLPFSRKS